MMTRPKAVVLEMQDNICRILEYIGVPMIKFSFNFFTEQFNCTLPVAFAKGLPKKELRNC